MTKADLGHHLPIIDRQKLSAVGLVLTTALLLVMAGVAAGIDHDAAHTGPQLASIDPADIKAETMFKGWGQAADASTSR